ncbi:hypothetical protein AAY473_018433 [Plecturocebus cupreus]
MLHIHNGVLFKFIFLRQGLTLSPILECSDVIMAHCSPRTPWLKQSSVLSLPKMESHCVAWTGLELLGSSDPPTLASQSAGITGYSYKDIPWKLLEHFGRPRWADHLRLEVQDQPCQHRETPSLLKNTKISPVWWQAPVIPTTWEAEAGELWKAEVVMESHSVPVWSAVARSRLIAASTSRLQVILLPQSPDLTLSLRLECSSLISAHRSLRLLGSSDSPASAYRVTRLQECATTPSQFFCVFIRDWILPCWPGWSQTPDLKWSLTLSRPGWSSVARSRLTATSASRVPSIALSHRLECSGMILAPCNLGLLGLSDSPASTSRVAGTTDVRHHALLIFVILVETGFCHVGQAGLELLTSSDLPASGSQSAGITGSYSVVQAGGQCHYLSSWQPPPPGLKRASHLSQLLYTESCCHQLECSGAISTHCDLHLLGSTLWEAEAGGSPEIRSLTPAWPTWWNPVSTKYTQISWTWWQAPVIPATPETEAGELLEPGRRRRMCSITKKYRKETGQRKISIRIRSTLELKGKYGQAQWLMPYFGRPRWEDHLSLVTLDQPRQHGKTLSLQKIQKLARYDGVRLWFQLLRSLSVKVVDDFDKQFQRNGEQKQDWKTGSHSAAQAGVQWHNHSLTEASNSWLKESSCHSLPKMGSCYVAQAHLKLLGPSDPPALASQNRVLLCCPGWSAVVQSWFTADSTFWSQVILLPRSGLLIRWDYSLMPSSLAKF